METLERETRTVVSGVASPGQAPTVRAQLPALAEKKTKGTPRVLLFGYNGANNTGSEARLLSIIEDVRAVLGEDAHITVPTLCEANLRRYLSEGPRLHIAPVPSLFPLALHRLVKEHDVVVLVEGSCYMDGWTSALLWAFLWASRCARKMGKPCLAYAVDAGSLSPVNQRLVAHEASNTDLIITRTRAAANRLRGIGVTAPLAVTGDCAFTFHSNKDDDGFLAQSWPEARSGVVGLAVVDFYQWPVVLRPWGRKGDCYRWPYYFSRSPRRTRSTEALATELANLADRIVAEHGKSIAVICMEELDEPLARQVIVRMRHAGRARIFSSRQYDASRMACLLRRLDLLITSRYHAAVLSLAGRVPQVAVGHDRRLRDFYHELGLGEDYFFDYRATGLWEGLAQRVTELLDGPEVVRERLEMGYVNNVLRAMRNRALLRQFMEAQGWPVTA